MIIPDVNVLVYAYASGSAFHDAARRWFEAAMSGRETVGFAPVVVTGFLRLVTSPRVLESPMGTASAVEIVESWLDRPNVAVLSSDARHLALTLGLIRDIGVAGNLTTDANIAAHALQLGATVATNDADFHRFAGVRLLNPLV